MDTLFENFGEAVLFVFLEEVHDAEFAREEAVRGVADEDNKKQDLNPICHPTFILSKII